MDYVTLGRTGLRASVIGLGAGGPSRLGQSTGRSEAESVAVVRRALDLGINFIDTAQAYGTEPIVGKALRSVPREQVILSTKMGIFRDGQPVPPAEVAAGVEESLRRLGVDYLDIFHLHGVQVHQYDHAINHVVPVLLRLREQGKIRWLGITESFGSDTRHEALRRALADDCWDVMMVGFNLLNQSARTLIFPQTQARNIGVLIMFAVRRALSNPERLRATLQQLVAAGQVDPAELDLEDPLGFLLHEGGASSLPEAAYRFCRYEPGVHVVLSGTGNVAHLEENVRALLQPPLPPADVARLRALFGRVDSVSGN
ncbi:aldo/keto reductase [Litorilinea aerophila]|uniref:Aldo/keto reductase n=1 Tax=Litorilinea aerophila TaxID=1204385 RepID=A0A540VER4_9CHLR|nr:aldo/keto reductase [Litorilinea aerophila]MCC9076983.1 aldo/keto reductase [Litorilinea aerophila]OUC05698.1 aldo/keto reductase [Litorilinea aerophila]GIV76809.1 MAG: D-threo-aldose 1-dehydrogenase [Litorilinea sp.]